MMQKRNRHGLRKFSTRFFRLLKKGETHVSPVLEYSYTSTKTSKKKGRILLDGCSITKISALLFEIRHAERGNRQFQVETESECTEWVTVIAKALSLYESDCREADKKDSTAKGRRRSSIQIAIADKTTGWSDDEDMSALD